MLISAPIDRLLLLQRGGETVYFGDIGPNAKVLTDYLARNGAVCPDDVNPAEFMLDAIGNGSRKRVGPKDWAEVSTLCILFARLLTANTCSCRFVDLPRIPGV